MGLGLPMDYKRRVGFRFYELRTYVDSYRRVVFRVYRPRVNIEYYEGYGFIVHGPWTYYGLLQTMNN